MLVQSLGGMQYGFTVSRVWCRPYACLLYTSSEPSALVVGVLRGLLLRASVAFRQREQQVAHVRGLVDGCLLYTSRCV